MNYPSTHAVAGFVAGMVSTSVLHPMDLVKTRLQGMSRYTCYIMDGRCVIMYSTGWCTRTNQIQWNNACFL